MSYPSYLQTQEQYVKSTIEFFMIPPPPGCGCVRLGDMIIAHIMKNPTVSTTIRCPCHNHMAHYQGYR